MNAERESAYLQGLADTWRASGVKAKQICVSDTARYLEIKKGLCQRYGIHSNPTALEDTFISVSAARLSVMCDRMESDANYSKLIYVAVVISYISAIYRLKPSTIIRLAGMEYFEALYENRDEYDEKLIRQDVADFEKHISFRRGRYESSGMYSVFQAFDWVIELTPAEKLSELLDGLLKRW